MADVDAVVIGAGFAGLAAANRLLENGFSMQGFEAAKTVGGTWYWNRYPGARCDVPSLEYSYRFSETLQQDWAWSERFASQPEILRYAEHVADRFDLRRHFRFHTRVDRAEYDADNRQWIVATSDGARLTARFLIAAVGCLSSAPNDQPDIPGLARFEGRLIHTSRWPEDGVDLAGKRVGVIGTGSSGVQAIPEIARRADALTVFQRTATYCVPTGNRALDAAETAAIKADYTAFRARCGRQQGATDFTPLGEMRSALEVDADERRRIFDRSWDRGGFGFQGAFWDLAIDLRANDLARAYFRDKIAEIVPDAAVAAKLAPRHRFATKRLCFGDDYYQTFALPHVHLVDLQNEPIVTVETGGVRTSEAFYPFDALVLATGFDALTGPLRRIDIRGRDGRTIADTWEGGAQTYLGLAIAGFPNLFVLSGPGSPSVLSNMVYSIEQNVDWVAACLARLRDDGMDEIEALPEAQQAWGDELDAAAAGTLLASGDSWYTGANIAGKPRSFMIHLDFPGYVARCDAVAADDYPGFRCSGTRHGSPAGLP